MWQVTLVPRIHDGDLPVCITPPCDARCHSLYRTSTGSTFERPNKLGPARHPAKLWHPAEKSVTSVWRHIPFSQPLSAAVGTEPQHSGVEGHHSPVHPGCPVSMHQPLAPASERGCEWVSEWVRGGHAGWEVRESLETVPLSGALVSSRQEVEATCALLALSALYLVPSCLGENWVSEWVSVSVWGPVVGALEWRDLWGTPRPLHHHQGGANQWPLSSNLSSPFHQI